MKKHLRIAALQCNFQTETETLKMPEVWHDFGFSTEQILHTHADMYSAVYDPAVHGKLMAQYLAKSKALGTEAIIYMNCHILGPSIADLKDEWGVVDENGNFPLLYNTYPAVCLNSGWADYFYSGLEGLKKYDIQGFFFDGPVYKPICHCPRCQAKFQKETGKTMAEATQAEIEEFYYNNVLEFKDNLYKKVKSINPDWVMYFNEGLFSGNADTAHFRRQIATDDLIGTEGGFFFYEPPKNHSPWYCSSCAKLAEAVANGKPTVIFFAGDQKPWGWFMHTPAETHLCYLSALGNGASIWYGIHCHPDNLTTTTGAAARELVQFDKKYDALYQETRSLADVALFYSFDTARYYGKSAQASDLYGSEERKGDFPGNYTSAVQGALGMLAHLNIAHDMVTELNLADLPRYKVIVAPGLAMVGDPVRRALDAYVAAGGVVIADGEFGMYDETGHRRTESVFAASAGFRPTGKVNANHTFNYCGFAPELYKVDNAFGWMPIPEWSLVIAPDAESSVFGWTNPPMEGCYLRHPGKLEIPFAVEKSFGKGTYYTFAGGAFEFYYAFTNQAWRGMMGNLIRRHAASTFRIANASTGVAVSVRESAAGCTLVHLANYTSATRPITASAKLHDVELTVPAKYTKAVDLWTGIPLTRKPDGTFVLTELGEIAVIRLDA